jgi:phage head maturation protease
LWEISIVTFPLLAGARVHAVKQATTPGKLSHARTRAERRWGQVSDADVSRARRSVKRCAADPGPRF